MYMFDLKKKTNIFINNPPLTIQVSIKEQNHIDFGQVYKTNHKLQDKVTLL